LSSATYQLTKLTVQVLVAALMGIVR